MNKVDLIHDDSYLRECNRLWQNISQKNHQPFAYDLNSDVMSINHSIKPNVHSFSKIDFAIFELDHYKFFETIGISVHDNNVEVTSKELAKLMFLSLAQNQKVSPGYINSVFNSVCIFFSLMTNKDVYGELDESDYHEYFVMILTFLPTPDGLVKRFSPPSYNSATAALNLSGIINVYRSLSVPFTFKNLSPKMQTVLLNKVCLDVMGLTFRDYNIGGSFNFLGLEIGKHYIDHCANVFEEYFQFALALKKTYSIADSLFSVGALPVSDSHRSAIIGRTLIGEDANSIVGVTKLNRERVEKFQKILLKEFRKQYKAYATLGSISKYKVLNQIVQQTNLPERFDTYEFVRSMLVSEYICDWGKSSEMIFSEYMAALRVESADKKKKYTHNVDYKQFIMTCSQVIKSYSSDLPLSSSGISKCIRKKFSDALFLSDSLVGVDALQRMFFTVESAMCTLFVAITGWRKSEYGFPMSSIEIRINSEVLDNLYTPWRFNVVWSLPKTHGDAKINREITSYAYQIVYMASILNFSGLDNPAIYKPQPKKATNKSRRFESTMYIPTRVSILWLDFIKNYTLFSEANIKEYPELYDLRSSLREALPAYEYWDKTRKRAILELYQDNRLDRKTTNFLNQALTEEIKAFIKDNDNVINEKLVKDVSREVMSGISYPTAHAFRHVWAEAVLTRYRGDVGKVLRANFKHMDKRFFSAYLRDKEMTAVNQIAERTIINQIVRYHIGSANDKYKDYAGGFQRFVSKVAWMTKVVTPEEREEIVNKIGQKVIAIKANRWATCMLRAGTQHRAKCAENNVPQRRNASPEFCLGCTHSDISAMNYEGIVISIKDDVATCRSTKLPYFVKEPHIKILKLASARVKELRKNSGKEVYDKYIEYLEDSMKKALKTKSHESH